MAPTVERPRRSRGPSRLPTEVVSLRRDGAGPLARLAAEHARSSHAGSGPRPTWSPRSASRRTSARGCPCPAQGDTLTLWECLANLGATDLTIARVAEPHLDALGILASRPDAGARSASTTGTSTPPAGALPDCGRCTPRKAAPGSPPPRTTTADGASKGIKPWCSVAERATHALVTAWAGEERLAVRRRPVPGGHRPSPTTAPTPDSRPRGRRGVSPRCVAPRSPSTAFAPSRSVNPAGI